MSMKEKRLVIRQYFGCYTFINYNYLFLFIFFSSSIVATRSSCRICRTKTISTILCVEFEHIKMKSRFMTHKVLQDFIYLLINIGLHIEKIVKVGLFFIVPKKSVHRPRTQV